MKMMKTMEMRMKREVKKIMVVKITVKRWKKKCGLRLSIFHP